MVYSVEMLQLKLRLLLQEVEVSVITGKPKGAVGGLWNGAVLKSRIHSRRRRTTSTQTFKEWAMKMISELARGGQFN